MSENRDLTDQPVYSNGDQVIADLAGTEYRGYIRGVATRADVLIIWIIEVHPFDLQKLPKEYPYPCIVAPHPLVRLDEQPPQRVL